VLAVVALAAAPDATHADSAGEYLASLRKAAQEKHLSENATGHPPPLSTRGSSAKSLIDDPKFFLAANGKQDPRRSSMPRSMLLPRRRRGDGHPRCRFVARYDWLKGQLGIEESLLPP